MLTMKHIIKITFTNKEEITTKINGTEDEIYKHYRENNFSNWCNNNPKQIKRIEFVESPLLKDYSSKVYLFVDSNNNGLLQ